MTSGWLLGYGYRPLRLLFPVTAVVTITTFFYANSYKYGAFAPRDAQILVDKNVGNCVHPRSRDEAAPSDSAIGKSADPKGDQAPTGPKTWKDCLDQFVPDYPRFDPLIYSVNVMFPIADLFQKKSWVPVRREVVIEVPYSGTMLFLPKRATEAVVYAELAFGALVSILVVALFSGLIRKVRPD